MELIIENCIEIGPLILELKVKKQAIKERQTSENIYVVHVELFLLRCY